MTIPHSTKISPAHTTPDGMVTVPGGDMGAAPYAFGSRGLEIEQGDGCDLQLPWWVRVRVRVGVRVRVRIRFKG